MTITTPNQTLTAPAVVVYTQPNCVQCKQTFFMLDRAGVTYTKVDVTEDDAALAYVKGAREDGGLGYLAAPVVVVSATEGDTDWNGFRPDLIKSLIVDAQAAA